MFAQIYDRHFNVKVRNNEQFREPVVISETGTQGLVTADDLIYRTFEHGRFEPATNSKVEMIIVVRSRFELVQKPHSLLGKRKRKRALVNGRRLDVAIPLTPAQWVPNLATIWIRQFLRSLRGTCSPRKGHTEGSPGFIPIVAVRHNT